MSQDNFGYSIRGISAAETSLAGNPILGIYVDGVYIARNVGEWGIDFGTLGLVTNTFKPLRALGIDFKYTY